MTRGSRCPWNAARTTSRLSRAMNSSGIPFGHTASHSPWFEQPPNASRRMAATMFSVRSSRSGCPCGTTLRWVTFAEVNSMAAAVWHPVDEEPARSADALAAIVLERDGLLAVLDELLVHDVEHLEERHVGRDAIDLVRDESSARGRIFL